MADDPPSSSNEPANSQRRRSLLRLGLGCETTAQPGSASGHVALTPSTPSAVKSTPLAVGKHGAGTALESAWIQRLKPASFNASAKAVEPQSSLLLSNCGRKDDQVSGTGSKPSEGVNDNDAEVRRAGVSRPRQIGEDSREEAAATAPWEWIEKVSSNHVVVSRSRDGTVCGEAYEMEKSHLVMGMKGSSTHTHATESFYQQRIKRQFDVRQEAHQASALSNANKGFEIANEGFNIANKGIGGANKGIGYANNGSDTQREAREMHLKGVNGLHHKNELKEDSLLHRGASTSCLQMSKESPEKAKGNLWFCQTEGHMRVIVPKADSLKKGFPLLPDTAKEGMMASSIKLNAEGIVSNLDNPKISLCSPIVRGFGPLRTSIRKPPLPPAKLAPRTVSTDRAILFRSIGASGEASLNVGESERKMVWELSKRSLCASSVADKEKNVHATISSKAAHREDPVLERAVEKDLCAIELDSRKLEMNFLESLEQPLPSHARHHGFRSSVGMSGHASIGLSLRTGWLEDSFASKFENRCLWEDLMPNSTGTEQEKEGEQLAPSQEEDSEAGASNSGETQSGVRDSTSQSSPTSVVQLFEVADNVRVVASSSSTASLPLELQKLNACGYPVSNFSVSEDMPSCEEKSQKEQYSNEQLDLNRSLSSSGEEDQTPLEDFQSKRREVESFPMIQQSTGQKLPHSLAGGTQRHKFVLPTIMNDKRAGELFSCSAKRSRPNENEGREFVKSDAETNASTGGNEGEAEGCMLGSQYSWLQRWRSPPHKTSTLRLPEPVYKSKENDQNNTFGSDFMNISRSDAFRNIWNESFHAKTTSHLSLQQDKTPIRMATSSAQGRMEFFSYGASSSRAYITSSEAALALAGTVPKPRHPSPSRCKGFLEVFPSAGRRHSLHHSKHLHEVHIDPQARNDDVQSAEHSISSS